MPPCIKAATLGCCLKPKQQAEFSPTHCANWISPLGMAGIIRSGEQVRAFV